jgi:hypothetical protein
VRRKSRPAKPGGFLLSSKAEWLRSDSNPGAISRWVFSRRAGRSDLRISSHPIAAAAEHVFVVAHVRTAARAHPAAVWRAIARTLFFKLRDSNK